MKTKEKIKETARTLFNKEGIKHTTLRHVAAAMGRSYGNITYHYPTKAPLLEALYEDMVAQLQLLSMDILNSGENLLAVMMNAPMYTFDLSMEYLFFFKDYVEIQRSYPAIAKVFEESNAKRKKTMVQSLLMLQVQQKLRLDLGKEELDYLMELSGVMRTFFFMRTRSEDFERPALKQEYVRYVNQLLMPYLTETGLRQYDAFMQQLEAKEG